MYLEFMKQCILYLFLIFSMAINAQNAIKANEAFKESKFSEALEMYQALLKKSPKSYSYTTRVISCFQQLERYQEAKVLIEKTMLINNSKALLVYLGYNYLLMEKENMAESTFEKCHESIIQNTNNVYVVARQFEQFGLTDKAVKSYEIAAELSENPNFQINLARLYGEQGNITLMIDTYINYLKIEPSALNTIKVKLYPFLTESKSNQNNQLLKQKLVLNIQQDPNTTYNKLLSWLYIIEKQYKKAFIQEKAILSREEGTYYQLIELARLSEKSGDLSLASSVYDYIIERCPSIDMRLLANQKTLNIKVNDASKELYPEINLLYESLLSEHTQNRALVPIIIDYARFLCFEQENSAKATAILTEKLKNSYPITSIAEIKLALGDVLVYQERFDEALIYYTQVQLSLKNSPIAQEARFRVAKTSFYKGDFKWAETQLKVLKSSISQLIANDALELKLVISDHKYEDSLQVALNAFSKASLLEFQKKPKRAIEVLTSITENHKEEAIVDDAIFKIGSIYETQKQYDKAVENYTKIIEGFKESILLDDAYYRLGVLYETIFNNPVEAKRCYEYILFNLENSIHLVESRKRFRNLGPDI